MANERRSLRISFILSTLWLSGGVRIIVEIANQLIQRGHSVCFVVSGGTIDPDVQREINPAVEIREAKVSGVGKLSLLQMARLAFSLAAATPQSDIIISTQAPTTAPGFLAGKILRKGKLVWFYQDYREMFLDRPVMEWLLKNALRWHECALVPSEYSREELHQYVPGKKVVVTSYGLSDPDIFRVYGKDELPPVRPDQKTILFLGDMRPRKGWYDFLEAARLVYERRKDVLLWIVSKETSSVDTEVPYQYQYRPTRQELAKLYATCDLFVLAAWWESFGLPGLEAMACGAPVVMTDTRGGREYARPGENCLMVKPKDPRALAEAIINVLDDPALTEKFRTAGPKMAAEFTWKRTADRFEQALLDCFSETA